MISGAPPYPPVFSLKYSKKGYRGLWLHNWSTVLTIPPVMSMIAIFTGVPFLGIVGFITGPVLFFARGERA